MDIYKLKDLSPSELRSVLDEAEGVEEGRYFQPLTEAEMDFYRRQHSEHAIIHSQIEHEFDLVKDEYKEKLKPHRQKVSEALEALRTRQVEKTGRIYILKDFDTKFIHKVDVNGNVIQSRPMLPEERQFFIHPAKQINE